MTGRLFDIQRFSVHDGDGIRTTVFLKGCPLRCAWCHNPEGVSGEISLRKFDHLCVGCGACVPTCPRGALAMGNAGVVVVKASACDCCGVCRQACVRNALVFDGFVMTAEELAENLLADAVFFEASGGGVTFSGGEPMAQDEFVREVAACLGGKNINTAIETSMACPWPALEQTAGVVQHFFVDLKIADPIRHREATGVDNAVILENFSRLAQLLAGSDRLTVRIPLIPGYTDDDGNLLQLGKFIRTYCPNAQVELMNFNPLAAAKYRRMHQEAVLWENAKPFEPEIVAAKKSLILG